MTSRTTIRGRIRHESRHVPVPPEVRSACHARWMSSREVAKALGVSMLNADALRSAGGMVREDVLKKVQAKL